MTETTAGRRLQAGQDYDPGYDVPDLAIGQRISGRTVIAAIRQADCPGFLPGLHIVAAYDPANGTSPYVTWEIAWQPYSEHERAVRALTEQGMEVSEPPSGRWVANGGHYKFTRASALRDMAERALRS